MKPGKWFASRGPNFVRKRATVLLNRYSITPAKAQKRIEDTVACLAILGCAPTFPTPGRVVERYSQFIRYLQEAGAEIAVHSYDHIDLKACPPAQASEQLVKAARVFERCGIEVHGFRCPYLSCTDDLLDVLPQGLFGYSSNKAIRWDVSSCTGAASAGIVFNTINRFYQPRSALDAVCVPWIQANLVEIPVCVPDDLQLHDGLELGPEGVAQAWSEMLNQTHKRGELFTLLFHPELAAQGEQLFGAVLRQARRLQPLVWIARLRDISDWWREKSGFTINTFDTPAGLHISFNCSPRATILARGLGLRRPELAWDGPYCQLKGTELDLPAEVRPFVGLSADIPKHVAAFLQEQGYILDITETATRCGMYIDAATLAWLTSEVKLVTYLEASTRPLVRYWRWPNGAKSAMSITGDLDALTLLDYASRLFAG